MEKILISACLLGIACRYDGKEMGIDAVDELKHYAHLIPVCPEVYGGLTTPRVPAERVGDRNITANGVDVTNEYVQGATMMMKLEKTFHCRYALLKEKSPSCGYGLIYDGTFTNTLTEGEGVFASMLAKEGIQVYGESQIDELKRLLMKK